MISKIDHIVLNVSSIEKAKELYENILGMRIEEFSKGRFAIKVGDQKINLHQTDTVATPKAKNPAVGAFDICFLSNTPLSQIKVLLETHNIELLYYDVQRTGTNNKLRSLYFYDFDGNLIEISNEI